MIAQEELHFLSELMTLEGLELPDLQGRIDVWTLIWSDFKHKLHRVAEAGEPFQCWRDEALARALVTRLLAEKLISVDELHRLQSQIGARPRYDILIVTPLEVELVAAKVAYESYVEGAQLRETRLAGQDIWEGTLPGRRQTVLKLGLTKVGRPRNVHMALLCQKLFAAADIGACVLVGMAGGRKGEVELGDVVTASYVLDYQGGAVVAQPGGTTKNEPECEQEAVHHRFFPLLDGFNPQSDRLSEAHATAVNTLRDAKWAVPNDASGRFSVHFRVIASGETVRRDAQKVDDLADWVTRRVAAVEMEGAGFSHACRSVDMPWCIFRGIADLQEPQKSKEWQPIASLNAALSLYAFLEQKLDVEVLRRVGSIQW